MMTIKNSESYFFTRGPAAVVVAVAEAFKINFFPNNPKDGEA